MPSTTHRRDSSVLLVWTWIAAMTLCPHTALAQDEEPEEPDRVASDGTKLDVQYIPTPQTVVDLMLELAQVKQSDLVYDLGCGDGRIPVTVAKKYGCTALGVDLDPDRVRESLANVKEAGVEDLVTIERRDVFELDLSKADVVTLFLLPELNVRLIPQLDTLKPGSRIVSYSFPMQGVIPDTVVTVADRSSVTHKIYLWTVPLLKTTPSGQPESHSDQPPPPGALSSVLSYVSRNVLLSVSIMLAVLAVLFWLLSKRLGVIRVKVSLDRHQKSDNSDTTSE